ncbi:hypothetical protein EON63_06255 [archaeon]|nr:MAG: hypothetical protein EON63_06255 [archaeon]
MKEMNEAYRKLVPWGTEATPEVLNQWFTQGATDTTGTAVRETQGHRYDCVVCDKLCTIFRVWRMAYGV